MTGCNINIVKHSRDQCQPITSSPSNYTDIVSPQKPFCMAKADCAASYNNWRLQDAPVLKNIHPDHGPPVGMPDKNTIGGTQAGYVPLSTKLSKQAQRARILPSLCSASLISLGQLADDGCTSIIKGNTLQVLKNGELILQGQRNPNDNLYNVPIYPDHPNSFINTKN